MNAKSKRSKSETGEPGIIHELFEHQLQDILWAEQELTKFMPQVVEQISSEELVSTIKDHIKITENQIKRLENCFELLGVEAKAVKCDGMEGLIKEAKSILEKADEGVVRDAFIIGAIQKVEHYEMASYGTLKALATIIGEYEIATLLSETLEEEKEADMNLTEVAENMVNIEASRESGELEENEEFEEEEVEAEEDYDELEGTAAKKSKSKARK